MNLFNPRKLHNAYLCANPFPHMVFTDVFDKELLRRVAKECVPEDWNTFNSKNVANKHCLSKGFQPASREAIDLMQSVTFRKWITKVTGHRRLMYDPYCKGGGLHATGIGGRLEIHADFNHHKKLRARRRVNIILFLNEDWPEEWGGDLELWDLSMTKCVQKVSPQLGTMVMFNTTSTSWHGHPHPLTCPEGVYRKSIAMYYYQEEEVEDRHSTIYKKRPK